MVIKTRKSKPKYTACIEKGLIEKQIYTNSKDINGKECWTGDVVKSNKTGLHYQIVFCKDTFAFVGKSLSTNSVLHLWNEYEIVGDIHTWK